LIADLAEDGQRLIDHVAHSAPADAKIRKHNKDIVLIRS